MLDLIGLIRLNVCERRRCRRRRGIKGPSDSEQLQISYENTDLVENSEYEALTPKPNMTTDGNGDNLFVFL